VVRTDMRGLLYWELLCGACVYGVGGPLVFRRASVVVLQFGCGSFAIFPGRCGIFAFCCC